MTLKEKALLLSGKGMWKTYDFEAYGIPAFFLSDGPLISGYEFDESPGSELKPGFGDCCDAGKAIKNSCLTGV